MVRIYANENFPMPGVEELRRLGYKVETDEVINSKRERRRKGNNMATYYGVVRDNRIVLPEGVRLEEGAYVEVSVFTNSVQSSQNSNVQSSQGSTTEASIEASVEAEGATEEAFLQKLLKEGLIAEIKRPPKTSPAGDRTPVKVKGKPMSQTIIEDRR